MFDLWGDRIFSGSMVLTTVIKASMMLVHLFNSGGKLFQIWDVLWINWLLFTIPNTYSCQQ